LQDLPLAPTGTWESAPALRPPRPRAQRCPSPSMPGAPARQPAQAQWQACRCSNTSRSAGSELEHVADAIEQPCMVTILNTPLASACDNTAGLDIILARCAPYAWGGQRRGARHLLGSSQWSPLGAPEQSFAAGLHAKPCMLSARCTRSHRCDSRQLTPWQLTPCHKEAVDVDH